MFLRRIKLFSFAIILTLILFAAPSAFAHANLVRSEPPADSAQSLAPNQVRLWFSEEVEPRLTDVSVNDSSGQRVDLRDSQRMIDDPKGMQVSLPNLPPGLYTVVWHTVSATDGHSAAGSFSFTIGDTPLIEIVPRQITTQVETALSVSELPPTREIVVRWLNLFALILLVGSFFFPILILHPATPMLAPDHVAWRAWLARWTQCTAINVLFYAVLTVAILMNQLLSIGGANALLIVLTATRFGAVWIFRVIVLIALGILLFRAKFTLHSDRMWRLGAGLGFLLVLSQGLDSHGAAISDPPFVSLLTDIVHLSCAGIWIGGLAQLILTLSRMTNALERTIRVRVIASVIVRFSQIVFVTVAIIAATGAFATYVQIGSFEAFWNTLYGATLLIKLALLVPLLLIAAFNLIVTRPAFAQAIAERTDGILARFNISVALEIIFALAILFCVGIMTSTAPGRAAYDPSSTLWFETHRIDDLNITLAASPALVGSNAFDVYLRDAARQPVSNATVVRLLGTSRTMNMGTQEITLLSQGNGHYTLRANLLSMTGDWTIEVLARRAAHDDARTVFNLFTSNQAFPPETPRAVIALTQPPIQGGLGLIAFGFIFGVASALLLRQARARRLGLIGAIIVAGLGAIVVARTPIDTTRAANPSTVVIPVVPEFARLARTPFRIDQNRLDSGRATYESKCTMCHGATGHGDGPSTASLNPRPFDLTAHAPLHTDGELYWWITNGIPGTAMPAWSSLNDVQRWEVVAYIRAAFGNGVTPTPTP